MWFFFIFTLLIWYISFDITHHYVLEYVINHSQLLKKFLFHFWGKAINALQILRGSLKKKSLKIGNMSSIHLKQSFDWVACFLEDPFQSKFIIKKLVSLKWLVLLIHQYASLRKVNQFKLRSTHIINPRILDFRSNRVSWDSNK